jgi:hypothetical protein
MCQSRWFFCLWQRIQAVDKKTHCVTAWDVETPGIHSRKASLCLRNRRFLQLSWLDHKTGEEKILWKEIDRQSRIYFPALFLLFVVFYWPILLLKKVGWCCKKLSECLNYKVPSLIYFQMQWIYSKIIKTLSREFFR